MCVGAHQLVPVRIGAVDHGFFELNSGVVDEDIDVAELTHRKFRQCVDLSWVTDISLQPVHGLRQIAIRCVPAAGYNPCPLGYKCFNYGAADPTTATGNHGGLVMQLSGTSRVIHGLQALR